MIAQETLKLNLGSRTRSLDGYKNMDIDSHPGVDYVGDVSDLSRFSDGSISEIYASHILEHFPHVRTVSVLKEWRRVLIPNGILRIAVPDFKRAVELYHKYGFQDWILNFLWGDQAYATAYHYTAFDFVRLEVLLRAAGFKEASQVESFGLSPDDCSTNISTIDYKPVSLNVVAIK